LPEADESGSSASGITRPLIQLGLALVLGGCAIGDTVRGVHLKQ
jgi:hypothetical protein